MRRLYVIAILVTVLLLCSLADNVPEKYDVWLDLGDDGIPNCINYLVDVVKRK